MIDTSTSQAREQTVIKFWEGQKNFYSQGAKRNKRWHTISQLIVIVGGSTVPVMVSVDGVPKPYPLAVSLIVAIAAALDNFMDFGQTWLSYRQASEKLRVEKMMFDSRTGPYKKADDPLDMFALQVEKICGIEARDFDNRMANMTAAAGNDKPQSLLQVGSRDASG